MNTKIKTLLFISVVLLSCYCARVTGAGCGRSAAACGIRPRPSDTAGNRVPVVPGFQWAVLRLCTDAISGFASFSQMSSLIPRSLFLPRKLPGRAFLLPC
jgi:hypothetical protein